MAHKPIRFRDRRGAVSLCHRNRPEIILCVNRHLRIKFVDDTTALEILPRNGISLPNVAVIDIHKFSIEHNMKLNPKKCKEMLISFIQNDNFTTRPIVLGYNTV